MTIRQPSRDYVVMLGPGQANVDDAIGVNVSEFYSLEIELPSSESMPGHGDAGPCLELA
jgi:hypothetical protein